MFFEHWPNFNLVPFVTQHSKFLKCHNFLDTMHIDTYNAQQTKRPNYGALVHNIIQRLAITSDTQTISLMEAIDFRLQQFVRIHFDKK